MRRREFLTVVGSVAGSAPVAASTAAGQSSNGTNTPPTDESQNGTGGNISGNASGNQSSGGAMGQSGETHTIGMTATTFEPDSLSIAPGDTVIWENGSSADHSVTAYADNIPEGATYFASGGFGDEETARSEWPTGAISPDESYEHTFQTTGTFEYFCIPHESAGMTGSITVEQGGAAEGASLPSIPDTAKTLGLATSVAMGATLGLTYIFLKYGGGVRTRGPD